MTKQEQEKFLEAIKGHELELLYIVTLGTGIPPKTVQHLMGHSDIETTMNIYTHIMKEQKLEAVEKVNSILG